MALTPCGRAVAGGVGLERQHENLAGGAMNGHLVGMLDTDLPDESTLG